MNNYANVEFNAYEAQQWPPYFNLEEIGDIPLAELKQQVKMVKKTNINEFLHAHDTKAEVSRAIDLQNQKAAII